MLIKTCLAPVDRLSMVFGMELTAVPARLVHSSPFVTATVYSYAIKGRDREAQREWEELKKKDAVDSSGSVCACQSGMGALGLGFAPVVGVEPVF